MKKLTLILLLFIYCPKISFGQIDIPLRFRGLPDKNIDSLINKAVRKLKHEGIDTIGYSSEYCVGDYYSSEQTLDCEYKTIYYRVYMFWQFKGHKFIQLIDNCGNYVPLEISNNIFFDYFYKNEDTIIKEESPPIQYYEKNRQILSLYAKEGKTPDSTLVTLGVPSHDCINKFVIFSDQDTMQKFLNASDLEKSYHNRINLNYEKNLLLKIVEWNKLVVELIDSLEKKRKFKRL